MLHCHRKGNLPPVVVFASPRGGSTWITELIASQPRFWLIQEPLNVRYKFVESQLGTAIHSELYTDEMLFRIKEYYTGILDGRFPELKLVPCYPFYRPLTDRIVVKQNQACLNKIGWFEDIFGVKVIHFLRHPVAVALSREVLPICEGFETCALRDEFSSEQLLLADRVFKEGSALEKGVVAWSLHHVPALRDTRPSWLTITYEETVSEPDRIIELVALRLNLRNISKMKAQILAPSSVAYKSDRETRKALSSRSNRSYLIEKWRERVSIGELSACQEILDVFGVSKYRATESMPQY